MDSSGGYTFKFLVVGNSCVGKTCIVRRLCYNDFIEGIPSTVAMEFMAHTMEIDGQLIKLQIWDTAGQEKYQSIGKAYYRGGIGALLVFSLIDHDSFEKLGDWYDQVRKFCDKNVQMIVVGNKADLTSQKAVTEEEIQEFAKGRGIDYIESSARLNKNVSDAFYRLAKEVYQKVTNGDIVVSQPARKPVPATDSDKRQCGC